MRRTAQTMIPRRREDRDRRPRDRPEVGPEDRADRTPDLLQVAIVRLAPRRIAVIARRDREARAARRDLREQVLLVGVLPRRVDKTPVAEHRERERRGRPRRRLRREHRRGPRTEQIRRPQLGPIAVLAGDRQSEWGPPLVVAEAADRHADPRRCLSRGELAGAAARRAVGHGCRGARLVGREVHDHVQADEVGQVWRAREMGIVGCCACRARNRESAECRERDSQNPQESPHTFMIHEDRVRNNGPEDALYVIPGDM